MNEWMNTWINKCYENPTFENISLVSKIECEVSKDRFTVPKIVMTCPTPIKDDVIQMIASSNRDCCCLIVNNFYPNKNVFKHSGTWIQNGNGFGKNIKHFAICCPAELLKNILLKCSYFQINWSMAARHEEERKSETEWFH